MQLLIRLLIRWVVSAVALYITVKIGQALGLRFFVAPGAPGVEGVLIMVVVLGIVNAVLRPIVQLIALPVTCLTFGIFAFFINGLMFWLAGQVVPGFHVSGFWAPLFGSVAMSVISGALNTIVVPGQERGKH